MSFGDLTVERFLNGASKPAPGGGSASAITAMGAGLMSMVVALLKQRNAGDDRARIEQGGENSGTRD